LFGVTSLFKGIENGLVMTADRQTQEFLEQFKGRFVEIILSNQMHYNGKVLSFGNTYIKIVDKMSKLVYVMLNQICTISIKGDEE
jgi:hypothetical protein